MTVAGDFNGDGYTDIAVLGGTDPVTHSVWNDIPIAFGAAGANFTYGIGDAGASAGGDNTWLTNSIGSQAGVRAIAGDYDGDGLSDIAFVGPSWWGSLPVGFSKGDGTFRQTNQPIASWFMADAATALSSCTTSAKVAFGTSGIAGCKRP